MKKLVCSIILIGVGSIICMMSGLVKGGNIDQCTEKYNRCISSCDKQRQQCRANGNGNDYCEAGYTTCSTGCENHMHDCWKN